MPHVGIFLVGLEGVSVERAVEALSGLPGVKYAHPDHALALRETQPNDPQFHQQWNLRNVGENPVVEKDDGTCVQNCTMSVGTTCSGFCGGFNQAGNCYCDAECVANNDCCGDYFVLCGMSCVGSCGSMSPDDCWCDLGCVTVGDCCPDYQNACALGPQLPTGPCGCTAACPDFGNCCWDACAMCGNCTTEVDADVDASHAWDSATDGYGATEVVVAIVDDGFDIYHEDLYPNIWKNTAEVYGQYGVDDDNNGYVDDKHGWDATNGDGYLPIGQGHGTAVAGVAGAVGNNAIGLSGIMWNAKLMLLTGGGGPNYVSTTVAAYNYIRASKQTWLDTDGASGANVVVANSSFGKVSHCNGQYQVYTDAFNELLNVGVLSTTAVANEPNDQDVTGDVPGTCPSSSIITVTNTTADDELFWSAAYGEFTVDLAAPGTDIALLANYDAYKTGVGTSYAAPLVAGAIGLMHANAAGCFQDFAKKNPSAAALWMKSNLLGNVDAISELDSITLSGGRLNVHKALLDIMGAEFGECGDGCCAAGEDWNNCPSDCVLEGTGLCCIANGTPGCADPAIQDCVCDFDPSCCSVQWDSVCAAAADFGCDVCNGDCCTANWTPGCTGSVCETCVCEEDSYCCSSSWDGACVNLAKTGCSNFCGSCVTCGDGYCGDLENPAGCPADCPHFCGDGFCTGSETSCLCPGDCGAKQCDLGTTETQSCSLACATQIRTCTSACTWGDFSSCADSCNDGCCGATESVGSCPGDCAGSESCCTAHGSPGCDDLSIQQCVCADSLGSGCCSGNWTEVCAAVAESCGSCSGDCCLANNTPGCTGTSCEACVCALDYYCCDQSWDEVCMGIAIGSKCADECAVCDSCGNGSCGPTESSCSCSADCGSICGDGCCSSEETPCGCPGDCGPICGDGCCTPGESSCSCAVDCPGPCCGDGFCNGEETCDGCPEDCSCADGNECTDDSCTPQGCQYFWKNCNDGNQCTTDYCEVGSCVHVPHTNPCDDGNACTFGDTCQNGGCVGAQLNCSDGNSCTNDFCSGGVCVNDNNGYPCEDGSACTVDDFCSGGFCQGSLKDCDDDNACTIDGCSNGNCTHQNTISDCDDGNPCTVNDTCAGGTCIGPPKVCDDGFFCGPDGSCVCAPKCEGKNCGDDGCGGECGLCAEGEGCAQGECKPLCPTSSFCTETPGDVTGDGFADISDVQCGLIAALWELAGSLGPMPMCCEDEWWRTDMNCDQATDVSDVLLSINMALALPMGGELDQNVDGCADSCQDVPDPGCDTVFDE